MGADLIVVAHPAPLNRHGQPLGTVTDEVRAEVERRINAAAPTAEAVAVLWEQYAYGAADEGDDDLAFQTAVISEVVDKVCAYITEWQDARSSGWQTIGDRLYVITGGTSWGDDPCDNWDAAACVYEHDLFDEPFDVEVSS